MTDAVVSDAPRAPRRRRRRERSSQSEYISRPELLALVPLCKSMIDRLEKRGVFPSRFVLEPTRKVAWKRSEVLKFLNDRAKRRVHRPAAAAAEPSTTA